jgi:hypothetical protein
MFGKQLHEYIAGAAISLASVAILPSKEGHAQSSNASPTANKLSDARMPNRIVFGQPSGFLHGYKLQPTASDIPQSAFGNSLPLIFGIAGATLTGLWAAGAFRKGERRISAEQLSSRHLICAVLGGVASYTASAPFTTYRTVEGLTQVSRVVSTSDSYYKLVGGKMKTSQGPYYRQEFFIPEISTMPLSYEVKDRPLGEGDILATTFYINDNKEIVAWRGDRR